jgi:hypothetical protein
VINLIAIFHLSGPVAQLVEQRIGKFAIFQSFSINDVCEMGVKRCITRCSDGV